jgi:hypothetical protein
LEVTLKTVGCPAVKLVRKRLRVKTSTLKHGKYKGCCVLDVEVSIHSLSGQVVTAKVSSAAPSSILHRIISKSFGIPTVNQRIVHGTVPLDDTSLPMHDYGIVPPKASLSFMCIPARGTKILVQAEKLHTEFPIAAKIRGVGNSNLKYISAHFGWDILLHDLRKTSPELQGPEPHQSMFLWLPNPQRHLAGSNASLQAEAYSCRLQMQAAAAAEDLLLSVYDDHEEWAADRNLPHPHDLQPTAPDHEAFLQPPPVSGFPAQLFTRLVFGGKAKFWERSLSKWRHRPY